MKKFILPLLLILSISMLIAAESEASDVVGYWKIDAPVDTWIPVSVPFQITDSTPTGVFGENWACDEDYVVTDMIVDSYNGSYSVYYTGVGWVDDNPGFVLPGHFYWVNRTQTALDTNFFLMGKVNPQPISLDMSGLSTGGWTTFAINDAVGIDPNELGFLAADPDWDNYIVDQIVCSNDGRIAEYWGEGEGLGWNSLDGLPFLVEPTKAYSYYSNNISGWTWTYPLAGRSFQGSSNQRSKK